MKSAIVVSFGLVVLASIAGCTGSARQPAQTSMVPPRVDLAPHQTIGVLQFDSQTKGKLGALATRRFVESARRDQGLLRVMELGRGWKALRTMGQKDWTPAAYKAIGSQNDLKSIFVGEISVSGIRPNISLTSALKSGSVTAEVDATLSVQLVDVETGASLWSAHAGASKSLGQISAFGGGEFGFEAENADEAYGVLVDALVEQVTADFHASRVRR
jgi:hypothetical protein